jgi:hypothetical protein
VSYKTGLIHNPPKQGFSLSNPIVVSPEKQNNPNHCTAVAPRKKKSVRSQNDHQPFSSPALIPPSSPLQPTLPLGDKDDDMVRESCKRSASHQCNPPSQESQPHSHTASSPEQGNCADSEDNCFLETQEEKTVNKLRSKVELHRPDLLDKFNSMAQKAATPEQLDTLQQLASRLVAE